MIINEFNPCLIEAGTLARRREAITWQYSGVFDQYKPANVTTKDFNGKILMSLGVTEDVAKDNYSRAEDIANVHLSFIHSFLLYFIFF